MSKSAAPPPFSTLLIVRFRPGCIGAYCKAHDELWPEIAQSLRNNLISISSFEHDGRLHVFVTAPSEAHWETFRLGSDLKRWDTWMTEFLEAEQPGKIAFIPARNVFRCGMFV